MWYKKCGNSRLEGNEGEDGLPSQLISGTYDCRYECSMQTRHSQAKKWVLPAVSATPLCKIRADSISAVERRCPETLMTSVKYQHHKRPAQIISHTVDTSFDPDIPMLVPRRTISSIEQPRIRRHVSLEVSLVVLIDGTRDRRPRIPQGEYTFDVVTSQFLVNTKVHNVAWLCRNEKTHLSRDRIEDDRIDTKERYSRRTWFRLDGTRERSDNDRSRFRLPKSINDCTLFPPYMFVIPIPCLRIDGFSNSSDNPQTAQVVVLDVLRSKTAE